MTALLKRITNSTEAAEDNSVFAARLGRLAEERKAPIVSRRAA